MGEPCSIVVAFMIDKYLRFMGKPPESRRVDDSVAVSAESIARRARGLRKASSSGSPRIGSINRPLARRFDSHCRIDLAGPRTEISVGLSAHRIGLKRKAMGASITVSERAARRIGDILKGEPRGTMLRVSIEGGGCSGFQYKFDMDRTRAADDLVISRDGAVILI